MPPHEMHRRTSWARALVAAVAGGAALLVPAIPAGANNPPGNDGTVKVDAEAFDTHPNNEPHVDCIFQVDFYGFDEGDLSADVIFEVHPPTGKPALLLDDSVFIGEDDHGGGGSEAGLDAEETYDLSDALASFTPHPKQGHHVKLTIHADGSQGADTKHKVFWVESCGTPPSSSVVPPTRCPRRTAPTDNPTASRRRTTSAPSRRRRVSPRPR